MSRLPDVFTSPEGLGFTNATIKSVNQTMTNELNSGETLSVQIAGHTWELTIGFPESLEDDVDSNVTRAFLSSLRGKLTEFQVVLPHKLTPRRASIPVTSSCTIDAGQSGSSLVIKNWNTAIANATLYSSDSSTGYISVNDYFKLDTNSKVYKVMGASYDAYYGTLTLDIFPNLVITTTGLEKPTFNEIEWNVKLTTDEFSEPTDVDGVISSFSITAKETY
jgi:hypothetical protein